MKMGLLLASVVVLGGIAGLGGARAWSYTHPEVVNTPTEDLRAELVRLGFKVHGDLLPVSLLSGERQEVVARELSRRFMTVDYPLLVAADAESSESPTATAKTDLDCLSR